MDTNKLLYWSPVFRWEIVDGCLKIELFNYGQQFSGLFPEFYFYTQKGILEEDLIEKMSYKNNPLIKKFIRDLIKRQILIYSPLEIQQLVHTVLCMGQCRDILVVQIVALGEILTTV